MKIVEVKITFEDLSTQIITGHAADVFVAPTENTQETQPEMPVTSGEATTPITPATE
jgi:hypothetical protein